MECPDIRHEMTFGVEAPVEGRLAMEAIGYCADWIKSDFARRWGVWEKGEESMEPEKAIELARA